MADPLASHNQRRKSPQRGRKSAHHRSHIGPPSKPHRPTIEATSTHHRSHTAHHRSHIGHTTADQRLQGVNSKGANSRVSFFLGKGLTKRGLNCANLDGSSRYSRECILSPPPLAIKCEPDWCWRVHTHTLKDMPSMMPLKTCHQRCRCRAGIRYDGGGLVLRSDYDGLGVRFGPTDL